MSGCPGIKATGFAALPDGVITLKKLSRSGRHGHHSRSNGGSSKNESASISGRVSALTAATDTVAGSITVGGIALPIPAGKVLRSKVAVGAFVTASAKVKDGVLTLKHVKVQSKAVTPVAPPV